MKKIFRQGVFETNSSSTHALCLCTAKEYQEWLNGNLYLDMNTNRIISREQVITAIKQENKEAIRDGGALLPLMYFPLEEEIQKRGEEEAFDRKGYKTYKVYKQYEQGADEEDYREPDWEFLERYTTPSNDEMIVFGYYLEDY